MNILRNIFHVAILLALGLILLDTRIHIAARVCAGILSIIPYIMYILKYINDIDKTQPREDQIQCDHKFTITNDGYYDIVSTHCEYCGYISDVKKPNKEK